METAQAQDTQAPAANVELARPYTYNFKKVKKADFERGLTDEDLSNEQFMGQFDLVTDDDGREYYKRKSVTVTLHLPEFIHNLPVDAQGTVASILENTIASYCKQTYIDDFQPVGDHSWPTIQNWINTRGSRTAKWDYSEETFKAAVKSLQAYMSAALQNSQAGERFAKAAEARFSRAAITRQINAFEEEILRKILDRLDNWMEYVTEHEQDDAEDYTAVYFMWVAAINRHLKSDNKQIDFSQIL